jgi:hypothetical protein
MARRKPNNEPSLFELPGQPEYRSPAAPEVQLVERETEIVNEIMEDAPATTIDQIEVDQVIAVAAIEESVATSSAPALFDIGESWEEAWKGMPEFVQEDLSPYKSIYVHFENREDVEKFAKLVAQTITMNTRAIWYPAAEIGRFADRRYIDPTPNISPNLSK